MIFLYSFGDTFLFIQPHSQADDPPPRTDKNAGDWRVTVLWNG